MKAVLTRLQREPIEAERLLRSKALLIGGIPIRESSYDGVASQLIQYAVTRTSRSIKTCSTRVRSSTRAAPAYNRHWPDTSDRTRSSAS